MSKVCSKCGAVNVDDARFCRNCGTDLNAAVAAAAPEPSGTDVPCKRCGHTNPPGTRFCSHCGADQGVPTMAPYVPMPRRSPTRTWAVLGGIVVALGAIAVWWVDSARTPTSPTFDSAPPPSVLAASGAHPTAPSTMVEPPPAPEEAAVPASTSAAGRSGPPDSGTVVPGATVTAPASITAPAPPAATAAVGAPLRPAVAKPDAQAPIKATREPRAVATREQRNKRAPSPAPARRTPAPHRADDPATHVTAPAQTPPAPPPPRPAPAEPAVRSVQERCGNQNVLMRSFCEARACVDRALDKDPACVRVHAAEERRRQQQGGGG